MNDRDYPPSRYSRRSRKSLLEELDDRAADPLEDHASWFDDTPRPQASSEPRADWSRAQDPDPLPSFLRNSDTISPGAASYEEIPQAPVREPSPQRRQPAQAAAPRRQQAPRQTQDDYPPEQPAPPRRRVRQARGPAPAKRRPKRSWRFRVAKFLIVTAVILTVGSAAILAGLVTAYSYFADDPLQAGLSKNPAKLTILAGPEKVIAEKGVRRNHVTMEEMPQHLIDAVVATEDRRFFYHFGVDPMGIARAVIANRQAGRIVQGGSTLTQQLAKVLFLKPDRTYWRKMEEVLLALSLEFRLEKKLIMELYLNRIYFGAGNYGVEAAAQHYFGKSVSDITPYEAAMLAGLIKSPNYYAPTNNFERSLERGQMVLRLMANTGSVTPEEYRSILENPPTLRNYLPSESYGYIIDWVVQQLPELGLDVKTDMVVETTIDYELQGVAQRTVKENMDQHAAALDAGEAAAIIIDRGGAVRALVGGRDYRKNQFNHATQAKRQPGSTFKPFVFLTALEKGMTPDSLVHDGPLRIGNWSPGNYNDRYYGDVTLRDALAKSMNTVAVRLSEWAGRDDVIKTAHRLGISSHLEPNASIALGTSGISLLEMTSAYVPLANGGYSARPHIIKTIRNAEGEVIYDIGQTNWGRVIHPENVEMMNDMLSATIQYGTGNKASLDPHPAAGKTGTGQEYRDAWFIGYTAHYVTGVWLGNDDFSPMKRVTGGSLPTMIWHDLMVYAHINKEPSILPGADRAQRVSEARQPEPQRGGGSIWDDLFGGRTTTSSARDTTLGTPDTTAANRPAPRKSWFEELFSN